MSALDLFASAMGAFILIMIILSEFYLNVSPVHPTELAQQLAIAKEKQEELEKKNKELEEQKKELEKQAKATYLLVTLSWTKSANKKVDIDLYVIDPHGNKFNYSSHNRTRSHYPNSKAELSEDATDGPASEIWVAPKAEVGAYKVYYNYYSGETAANLTGRIFHANGMVKLPSASMSRKQNAPGVHVATIYVKESGEIDVQVHI